MIVVDDNIANHLETIISARLISKGKLHVKKLSPYTMSHQIE